MQHRSWLGFSIAALLAVVPVPRGVAQSRFDAEGHLLPPPAVSFNERVAELFDIVVEKADIAPMVTQGEAVPGAWTGVPNDLFDGILARAGIVPGASDPEHLAGRPGFLEFIEHSFVVNPQGTRATFGFFIRLRGRSLSQARQSEALGATSTGAERCVSGFILMSYDSIKGENANAFEVFVFGPSSAGKDSPPLLDGLAVKGDGELLSAVPLNIARVSNFRGNTPPTKAVTPGVHAPGQGCLECHSREAGMPQDTAPFPWVPGGSQAQKPDELAQDCSDKQTTQPEGEEHSSVGGLLNHFSLGVGVGGRNRGGSDSGASSQDKSKRPSSSGTASPPDN